MRLVVFERVIRKDLHLFVMKSCIICGFVGIVHFLAGSLISSMGCFAPFEILFTHIT